MSNDTTERNTAVVQALIDGATMYDVAAQFRMRVAQIRLILYDWYEHPQSPKMPDPDDIWHLPLEDHAFRLYRQAGIKSVAQLIEFLETGTLPSGQIALNRLGKQERQRTIQMLQERGHAVNPEVKPILYEFLPDETWQECLAYWGNVCAICGTAPTPNNRLVQDHWIPHFSDLFPGSEPTNIVPLCLMCNSHKRDSEPFHWLVKELGHRRAIYKMADISAYFKMWFERLESRG